MNKKYLKFLALILAFISMAVVSPKTEAIADDALFSASETEVAYLNVINTKKELIRIFVNHITNLDTNFTLKISNKALKNNNKAFSRFWTELTKYPEYNEIMEHAKINPSVTYNYSNYFVWRVNVKYSISKSKAKKLLKNISPIIKTEKELIDSMVYHAGNLDKNFYINIDKKVLNLDNAKKYTTFWNKLYEIPEFNDISRYYKNFTSTHHSYKTYSKWIIKTKYGITKKELNYMNNFVKSWLAENINDDMTEEEKVRAINDFMVENYRYTFGDKGKCPANAKNCPEEKLGKYSVYSTFSLLYGGGGVCDAKAKLFYRLAKEAGFEVLYVTGYVNKTTLHAWNMIKVDGNWYHLDNTWNRGTEAGMSEYEYINTRDYYLKSDATMRERKHSWKKGKYPVAKEDYPISE